MSPRAGSHLRFHELLAARLDGPLTRAEHRVLNAHLRTCLDCRRVDQDYRAQRAELQALPAPIPPRYLWARTSAAIDREVARGRYRPVRRPGWAPYRRQSAPRALIMTLAAIGVVAALAVLELRPGIGTTPTGEPGAPTPFSVADQQMTFIGSDAANVAIYSTQVNRVCPQSAPDCVNDQGITRTPVTLPNSVRPRNVALSPTGQQLALVGEDVGADLFAIVILHPGAKSNNGSSDASPRSTDLPRAPGGSVSLSSPVTGAHSSPAAISPDVGPPATGDVLPASPPASAVAGLTVVSILDDVHSAGSPPAWSDDGGMLAFSAMPADGSLGPDVYVWEPGESHARAITGDHATFFASWSGSRIVASRIKGEPADTGRTPRVATVVIDPVTLEEREVNGPQMWLPQVNAQGTQAVVWYGTLTWNAGLPAPANGVLYMVNWTRLDPWAAGATPSDVTTEPQPTQPPAETPAPETTPRPDSSTSPDASTAPDAPESTATTDSTPDPNASPTPEATRTTHPTPDSVPSPAAPPTDKPPAPEPTAEPVNANDVLTAIDPDRDPITSPVTDWQVRWSADGQVLGIWVADVAGSSWGKLVVFALDPETGKPVTDDALLPVSLARRGFTLGLDRVAWIAPTTDSPDGELHVRTWGTDGVGSLRVGSSLDLQEVVPAF